MFILMVYKLVAVRQSLALVAYTENDFRTAQNLAPSRVASPPDIQYNLTSGLEAGPTYVFVMVGFATLSWTGPMADSAIV